jgi:hypothetical protein
MILLAGRQLLLERQPLVLLGLLRIGAGRGKLVQRLAIEPGLLGELPAVAPVLKLPGAAKPSENQRPEKPSRNDHHGTSLKKTW